MSQTKIHVRQIKQLASIADVDLLFNGSIINPSHISGGTNITSTEFGYLDGVTSNIQAQLNAKLTSDNISNSPTWTETTVAPSAKAVATKIAADIATAFVQNPTFKGAWSTHPTGTNLIQQGWSYVYDDSTSEDPTGITLETGDYLVAVTAMSTVAAKKTASNWVIVQANLTGAVTAGEDLKANQLIAGNGSRTVKGYTSSSAGFVKISTAGIISIDTSTYSTTSHTHTLNIVIGSNTYPITINGGITLAASGGGSWSYSGSTLTYTAPTVPSITVTNGAAETDKYISAITASGHTITISKATMPTMAPIPALTSEIITTPASGTTTATLTSTPYNSTVFICLNGQVLTPTMDYTVSGTTVTFTTVIPFDADDVIIAFYLKSM